jgi:hypothetical protein
MLMLDGQLALTMSTRLTLMVPILLAVLTPLVLPVWPAPLAMADWSDEVELGLALVLPVAEPLTPPVLLALVLGAEPLCGSVLELVLAPAGDVLALALVVGVLLLLMPVEADDSVEGDEDDEPRLAEVVSGVPWIFT